MKYIKLYFILILLIAVIFNTHAQNNITITDDESHDADASAVLDVYSVSKGMLLPRLSNDQRDAINTPAAGLIIFNTEINKFQGFDGNSWKNLYFESCIPSQPALISGILFPECNEPGISYSISSVANATS